MDPSPTKRRPPPLSTANLRTATPIVVGFLVVVCFVPRAARGQPDPTDAPPPTDVVDTASDDDWERDRPDVEGYVQFHYRHELDANGDGGSSAPNFRVQRVRLGVEGDVLPRVSYDVEFDPRAPEITGLMRDAFLAFDIVPNHELRLGQQKTHFGYENVRSSTRLYTVNRSELADNLARGANLRDVGLGFLGHVEIGERWRFEDALNLVNGNGFNTQGDDTPMKNVWGRLGVRYRSPSDFTFRIGVSGGVGDQFEEEDPAIVEDDFRFDFWRVGTDVQVEHDWLWVAAEFAYGENDLPALTVPEEVPAEVESVQALYVLAALTTPIEVGPLVRVDTENDEFRRWTIGAYYGRPSARFRVLLNYEIREIEDDQRGDDRLYLWTQARF